VGNAGSYDDEVAGSPFNEALTSLPYRGEPLPRRHTLTREDVGLSQRGRLTHATLHVVAAKGYAATTIGDIVERAAVSRQTFYQHFPSKEACFLAAFDDGIEVVRDHLTVGLSQAGGDDWRSMVHATLRGYLELLAAEPAATWSMTVEIVAAGPECVARGIKSEMVFADLFRAIYAAARRQEPARPELPAELFEILVCGIVERVRRCLYTDGAEALPTLEPMFAETVFVLFGDRPAAISSPGASPGD
jgi:AcrR family transcriptional regulator